MTDSRKHTNEGGLLQRIVDYVFGYDFFLSYSHSDGKNYPRLLKQRLEASGFRVFLDQTDYVAGIDLRRETRRQVTKTRQFVIVAREGALRSEWIMREVQVALGTGKTPVILNINRAVENAPATAAVATIAQEHHWLRLDETLQKSDGAPSDFAVSELCRGFNYVRQASKRLRIVSATAGVFAVVAAISVWLAIEAERQKREAQVQRAEATARELAVISDFNRVRAPRRALGFAVCAQHTSEVRESREAVIASVRSTLDVSAFIADASEPAVGATLTSGGRMLIVAYEDGGIRQYHLDVPDVALPVKYLPTERINSVAQAPDGSHLLLGTGKGQILVLNGGIGATIERRIHVHQGGVTHLVPLTNDLVASTSYDNKVAVTRVSTGRIVCGPLEAHRRHVFRSGVYAVAYEPQRKLLITGGADGRLVLWDMSSPEHCRALPQAADNSASAGVWSVAVEPKFNRVVAGDSDGGIHFWRLTLEGVLSREESSTTLNSLTKGSLVSSLAFGHSGDVLVASQWNGGLTRIALSNGQGEAFAVPVGRSVGHGRDVIRIFSLPNSSEFLSLGNDGSIVKWSNTTTDTSTSPMHIWRGRHGMDVRNRISNNARYLATWDENNHLDIFNVTTRARIGTLAPAPPDRIVIAVPNDEGKQVAIGFESGTVEVWNALSGQRIASSTGYISSGISALLWRPQDAATLLSGSSGGVITRWRVLGDRLEAREIAKEGSEISALAFSGDGLWFAWAPTSVGHIVVQSATNPDEGTEVPDIHSGAWALALDHSGEKLAVGTDDRGILLYANRGHKLVATLPDHESPVRALSFSSSGRLLISGGDDRRLMVWEMGTPSRAPFRKWLIPDVHFENIAQVLVSENEGVAISVGHDGNIGQWSTRPEDWYRAALRLTGPPEKLCDAAPYRR